MALATATVTMDLSDLLGVDFDARRTKVWISTNVPNDTVIDTADNKIRLGSGNVTVATDGTASLDVWVPGSGSNPTSWQTYIHVDYPDRQAHGGRGKRTFGPFTITASADLADLVDEQEVPPEYVTTLTAELDGYVTDAEAAAAIAQSAADLASAITGLDNADDAITVLDANPASDFRVQQDARLSATIAAATDPLQAELDTVPEQITTLAAPLTGRGNAVVFIGDSHTERGSIPRVGATGSVELGGMVGMILGRVPSMRYRFNAGVSGEDTAEMIARWDADVVAYNPSVLHILGGTNDITGGVTQTATLDNLRWMIREGLRLGCVVFIGTVPPRNDEPLALDNIERMNVGIQTMAAEEGAHLIDYHTALVDPANGLFKSGLTTDNVHANLAGQKVMAVAAATVMNRVLPAGGLPVATTQYAGSSNRLGTNACFLIDSNADGVPDGWTAGGTATTSTISLVDDPDFIGKALQLTYTGASNRNVTTSVTSDKWAVGQRVAFAGKYKASGITTGLFTISLSFNASTAPNYSKIRPVNQAMSVDTDGVGHFYIEGVVPTGTNLIYVQINAISGAGTLKLGQVAMWVLGSDGVPV